MPILPSPDRFYQPAYLELTYTDKYFDRGNSYHEPQMRRILVVTIGDKEYLIRSARELGAILSLMAPEERKKWRENYRFAPVDDLRDEQTYYAGQGRDML